MLVIIGGAAQQAAHQRITSRRTWRDAENNMRFGNRMFSAQKGKNISLYEVAVDGVAVQRQSHRKLIASMAAGG